MTRSSICLNNKTLSSPIKTQSIQPERLKLRPETHEAKISDLSLIRNGDNDNSQCELTQGNQLKMAFEQSKKCLKSSKMPFEIESELSKEEYPIRQYKAITELTQMSPMLSGNIQLESFENKAWMLKTESIILRKLHQDTRHSPKKGRYPIIKKAKLKDSFCIKKLA